MELIMPNIYPDSFRVLQPMLPIVRKSLIHESDSLRESLITNLNANRFACVDELFKEIKLIHEFINELDKCVQFEDDDLPF